MQFKSGATALVLIVWIDCVMSRSCSHMRTSPAAVKSVSQFTSKHLRKNINRAVTGREKQRQEGRGKCVCRWRTDSDPIHKSGMSKYVNYKQSMYLSRNHTAPTTHKKAAVLLLC